MFPDAVTHDLYHYEQAQSSSRNTRAADLLDRIEAQETLIEHHEEELEIAKDDLADMQAEYDNIFDIDYYDGPETIWESGGVVCEAI